MHCPYCKNEDTKVLDSRVADDGGSIRRRRSCAACDRRFTTVEKMQLTVLKRFAPMLRSDGLLFVGHSENFFHAADIFRLRGKTVYELASTSKARLE